MHNKVWQKHKISELLERVKEPVKVSPTNEYKQIGIRSHGKGIFHKKKVTGISLGNKSVFKVIPNCFVLNIVFAWEQAIAKTTDAEKGMIASHRFPMFKTNPEKIDIDFLLYFFKSKRGKWLLELASPGGAGRNKTLGQQIFLNLIMNIPPIFEQKKIAETLSTWDKAIEKTEQLIKAKEQAFIASARELINKVICHNNVPKNKLSDIFTIYRGSTLSKSLVSETGKYPCILYGELYTSYEEVITSIKSRTSSNLGFSSMSNDLLIPSSTTTSAIDLANVTSLNLDSIKLGGDIIVLRAKKSNMICSDYFAYYLTHIKKHEIARLAQGITIIHLYGKDIEKILVDIPHIKIQKAIAGVLNKQKGEINLLRMLLETYKKQKQGLMQKLLTGKWRVKTQEE